MDQADAEHRAASLEHGVRIGCAIIDVEALGHAATLDASAQHVLARARVLIGHPTRVQNQPRVVVQKHEDVCGGWSWCVDKARTDQTSTSPIHSSLGREASNRPNARGWPP